MKSLILLLVLLASCSDNVEVSRAEYNKLKGIKEPDRLIVEDRVYDIFVGSDGHQYYKVPTYAYRVDLHYPGCKECSFKDSLINTLKSRL